MQVLEKILEEIEKEKGNIEDYTAAKDKMLVRNWNNCIDVVAEIIRSHMEDDGWIPVEERLPEHITQLSERARCWEREAKIQAAAAGELKIALTERLEEIKARKAVVSDLGQSTMSDMDKVVQEWKMKQFEEQEKWLEAVLGSGERENSFNLPPGWQKQMMDKFTERR